MAKLPWYIKLKPSTFVIPGDTGFVWYEMTIHPVYIWWIFVRELVKIIWKKAKSKCVNQ